MKRSMNKLLVKSFLSFALFLIVMIFSVKYIEFLDLNVSSDVFVLAEFMGLFFNAFLSVAMVIFAVFISFLVLLNQCIANLFQMGKSKDWKNIASKCFTILSMIYLCFLILFLLLFFLETFNLGLILAIVIIGYELYVFIKEFMIMKKEK